MSGAERLTAAFHALEGALPAAQYPLPIEGADVLRQLAGSLAQQTRDYLIPRAARLDAPLLAVVGGSTGAGKSTLVNSLLRAQLTRPGVLRPTTKSPVLICHPDDEAWFRSDHVLPGLVRTDTQLHDSRALHVVAFDGLPPGLALLDAPANAGMGLTESCAMTPAASVSGFYIGHPAASYFAIPKIGRDQLEDWARRKGMSLKDAEYWLAPLL